MSPITDADWNHQYVTVNTIRLHYVRHGAGAPLVLLHGWPEFWRIWRKVIPALATGFDVIAPDMRGFGDSEKPDLPPTVGYNAEVRADDLRTLADALGLARVGIVSHDAGAIPAQLFARRHPERVAALFFFDCPYPGIGGRWAEPDNLIEFWYQAFHTLPVAARVVGGSRQACEAYLRHFLDHWAAAPGRFEETDIAAWVDTYMRDGNLQAGFNWYHNLWPQRVAAAKAGMPPAMPKIDVPTCVRWGVADKVLRIEWADRLQDYFADLDFAPAEDCGHFAMYERPEWAARQIADFFGRVGF